MVHCAPNALEPIFDQMDEGAESGGTHHTMDKGWEISGLPSGIFSLKLALSSKAVSKQMR